MCGYSWMDNAVFLHFDIKTDILLILTGAATALPLVMYAKGVQRIPLVYGRLSSIHCPNDDAVSWSCRL